MAQQGPVHEDPEQTKAAQDMWDWFIKASKLSGVGVVIVLLILLGVYLAGN